MRLLGIDYGLKKIGLAIAATSIAEPLKVVRYEDIEKPLSQIKSLVQKEKIDKIVVGVSEGKMAQKTRVFAKTLQKNLDIPIVFFDETLTSKDAQKMAIESGIKRKKRKEMEDAFAATVMLREYLEQHI